MSGVIKSFICLILLASCSGKNEFAFVFLPDIHLRPDSLVEAHFDLLVRKINSLDPDFILTGGDMIYTAKNVDEKKAGVLFEFMDNKFRGFNMPVYYTIGNHETVGILEESGLEVTNPMWGKGMYEKRYGKRFYTFPQSGWRFFVLDGIKLLENERNYTQGVDSVQMEWLRSELRSTDRDTPIIISIHPPLLNPHAAESSQNQLLSFNNEKILNLFKEHNLKIVLEGHTHLYMNLLINGIHYISGGSTAYSTEYDNHHSGFIMIRVTGNDETAEFISFPDH